LLLQLRQAQSVVCLPVARILLNCLLIVDDGIAILAALKRGVPSV